MAGVEDLLAEGRAIIEDEARQAADRARLEAVATALAEMATVPQAILDLLTSLAARQAATETQLAVLTTGMETLAGLVQATRVRRAIRRRDGSIDYVVDEMVPPEWARPLTMSS